MKGLILESINPFESKEIVNNTLPKFYRVYKFLSYFFLCFVPFMRSSSQHSYKAEEISDDSNTEEDDKKKKLDDYNTEEDDKEMA